MKPADKARLQKARAELVRSLDVDYMLPMLKKPDMYTQEDEQKIYSDPRRRERMMLFLSIMERKSPETFQAFCDILEERFPHLYLLLSDSDWADDGAGPHGGGGAARLDDEWSIIHRNRPYLISQIDAANIAKEMRAKNILTEEQERQIVNDSNVQRRTETFLDFLEMRPPGSYYTFLEAVGEVYPHVYLALTDDGKDDDF